MRYFRIITYAEGDNYETREKFINEDIFRQFQKAVAEGKEFLVLEDRIIRTSTIKEVIPADDIVATYQQQRLKIDRLLETAEKPEEIGNRAGRLKTAAEIISQKRSKLYEKMGWDL